MSDGEKRLFFYAKEEEVLSGSVTDVYFQRARQVLRSLNLSERHVAAEVHAYSLPQGYSWGVLVGVKEVVNLLKGLPVNVYSMEEGELFFAKEPVMCIEGNYLDFGIYETAVLGILRHESSVGTKSARIKFHSMDKPVIFFGMRCVHPIISPVIDRAAYIGGCDAVSNVLGAELLGERPVGTMPHAFIIVIGDQREAWTAFDKFMPEYVPRIALCDTWYDERIESLMAAEALEGRLYGVRLDTPGSRRGNMRMITQEVRWSLNINGYSHVKIYVSGGIDEEDVKELGDVADGFGVGTSIAFPPSIDLAMDIVEVEGKPISKRGKLPGRKQVYRCRSFHDTVTPWERRVERCVRCGERVEPLLRPLIVNGEVVDEGPEEKVLRSRVLERVSLLKRVPQVEPPLFIS
ncbi:MAG: nicotinate phosphoribosyltransferase [Aigarchaeota archaeon]|nr:nicotinate phosphoribosyltransferase [Aigarchaeota archaeon]MDW8092633.1 nicotinate phosphoribosyltransferase [Nitrososphaerota archaeon]